jgi:hypothetical protein
MVVPDVCCNRISQSPYAFFTVNSLCTGTSDRTAGHSAKLRVFTDPEIGCGGMHARETAVISGILLVLERQVRALDWEISVPPPAGPFPRVQTDEATAQAEQPHS